MRVDPVIRCGSQANIPYYLIVYDPAFSKIHNIFKEGTEIDDEISLSRTIFLFLLLEDIAHFCLNHYLYF